MPINQFSLLKVKRFLPLFLTQFFGAFNDNLYKNALVILITYSLADQLSFNPELLITLAAGIFILPFFLFSGVAGQLADKYEKSKLIRYTKIAEIFLMLGVGLGFYLHSVFLLMAMLFLVGTQATFFGPMKYSILPDHLRDEELIAGNALLEAGTYLSILLGTIVGGILAVFHVGPTLVFVSVMTIAIAGFITSLRIPVAEAADPSLKINLNIFSETWDIVKHTLSKKDLFLAILGISWFWLIGATYLSQFPTYAKNILGAQSSVVTLFLTFFTLGIGVGSLLCNRLLKGKIHATYVPLAALGMTVFSIDLVMSSQHVITKTGKLVTLGTFLSFLPDWHILLDLFLIALCGGVYIVPLYAILQHESDPHYRSRAVASNNIINALFMVAAAIATSIMLLMHFTVTNVFFVVALANLVVAIYICKLLPEEFIRSFLIWIFKLMYRVEVRGMDNYFSAGNRVLIVANHTSFIDAALLAAFLPDRLTFAINTQVAQKGWIKWLLKLVNTYPIDPTNPLATKSVIEYLRQNKHIVIFPEGRITVTGALMKIYEGPGLIADKADAKLLPIRIHGAQYTPFSHLKGKVKIRWFPKITLTILKPRTFDLPASITGRERRRQISAQLFDMMSDTMFLSSFAYETLYESLLNAKSLHGNKRLVVEDIDRNPISYQRLVLGSLVLGRRIARATKQGENVGILLPNSVGAVVTFFAMQAFHRVPAMLNFTAGLNNALIACRLAEIKTIYTSHKFIERANLQEFAAGLVEKGLKLIYLEDVRNKINIFHKLFGKLYSLFPRLSYQIANSIKKENHDNFTTMPAVILFTSGSEGTPKGVALSHLNIQANRAQLVARVDFTPADKVFNALPMFHAFGLTAATLLPIISGMRVFMYPSPLHYKIVPELCYDTNSTIMFGTDTFLTNYAKSAHPYDFYSVRYIFAGAEKLRHETHALWTQKFGIRLFEGYGATEASPVLATNSAMQYKQGTVGRLLPGIRYQLQVVEGIKEGRRLLVSGPNVMLGYLLADAPGKIQPVDGYYDTGDIVEVDEEGFIIIKGRAKRFAKIAGEMVSLTAVEQVVSQLWPDKLHAVVSQPDPRKGEQIVLVTNSKVATQSKIIEHFRKNGIAEIGLPRKIIILDNVPLLGSGKVDYPAVKAVVEQYGAAVEIDDIEDRES
jgi:acyl-[acyl-carrier-protein]-phospholipid O-acyltransferase/long-chain-fatty-acid--[acyl-carrier-protein] ligase